MTNLSGRMEQGEATLRVGQWLHKRRPLEKCEAR